MGHVHQHALCRSLSWYPVMQLCLYNSFDVWVSVNGIYGYRIFKWYNKINLRCAIFADQLSFKALSANGWTTCRKQVVNAWYRSPQNTQLQSLKHCYRLLIEIVYLIQYRGMVTRSIRYSKTMSWGKNIPGRRVIIKPVTQGFFIRRSQKATDEAIYIYIYIYTYWLQLWPTRWRPFGKGWWNNPLL